MSVSHRSSSRQALAVKGHQALPFATATDGASVCVRVCDKFPVGLETRSEDSNCLDAAQGAGRDKPTLPRD